MTPDEILVIPTLPGRAVLCSGTDVYAAEDVMRGVRLDKAGGESRFVRLGIGGRWWCSCSDARFGGRWTSCRHCVLAEAFFRECW